MSREETRQFLHNKIKEDIAAYQTRRLEAREPVPKCTLTDETIGLMLEQSDSLTDTHLIGRDETLGDGILLNHIPDDDALRNIVRNVIYLPRTFEFIPRYAQ